MCAAVPRLALAALALALLAPAPAIAAEPTMPLSQVAAGMRCTGASVVRGTEITRFDVEVLDVVSGDPSTDDPRILVRASGSAVDETGIGPGFSGSPVSCPDAAGVPRVIGAISEAIGEYGGKVVLATPIEAMLGERPEARGARPARALLRRARPLAGPLTVTGVSPPVGRALAAIGRRAGRPLLAAPAGPLGSYPVQTLRPGAAMAVGYSAGDLALSAIGTVTYVDGSAVWGFGHPNDGVGARSLLLQDAYVFRVIGNPNVTLEQGTTYKLAAAGHPVGVLSNDALDAVVGRLGALPRTVPVRVRAMDLDTGRQRAYAMQVADEADVGDPLINAPLTFVAPVAVAQAASTILRSAPARSTATMCARLTLREAPRPVRVCNRYVTAGFAEEGFGSLLAELAGGDLLDLLSRLDDYKVSRLHVTGLDVALDVRRGQRQAFLRDVRLPARVRPGQTVSARVRLREFRGRELTRRYRVRIPAGLPPGARRLRFAGADVDGGGDLASGLEQVLTIELEEEGSGDSGGGSLGPPSIAALVRSLQAVERYDGVTVRAGGETVPGFRDPAWRLTGRVTTAVRVAGRQSSKR